MANRVIIGLGSNINPEQNIREAFEILDSRYGLLKSSGPVKTSPIGITDQPDFYNAVGLIEFSLSANELKKQLKGIEDEMGRDRNRPKYGPREIDLDILLWNGEVVDEDYYEREFLQQLVKEIRK
ncbi:2-amino-4-hydroxy-6-hydroxymethyldihydropteridine diphosphokinase [Marinilabilia rubra]|uniref:2-amino-4-hydroxy-6-hydroxymethyldihydropteridine pyrophosphokinase n=1 Tax=Marinilabilia rubra TaxID=2162893 RepID=A0A2U2B6T7_9BACT|nr:2-amino-4-hydroxy-6-hydroxymethyldihydropteridine diphosphokinase [Marinilabilia rubra]PWD98753.1 2-amino-4-hydroxy-6-hydroxymethyldihydropteridine diphosphokinase [Marinilabilia rubra]